MAKGERGGRRSGGGSAGTAGAAAASGTPVDFEQAFKPELTTREWDERRKAENDFPEFARQFGEEPSVLDETRMYSHSSGNAGYISTGHAFEINRKLYNPINEDYTITDIFSKPADRATIKALDKNINSHSTPADGAYTRFCTRESIKSAFGLTTDQLMMLEGADGMTRGELKNLSKALTGTSSLSLSYTSTSANREMNVFTHRTFERRISVPKGTKAFACSKNADEAEVIFGRGMKTKITGISVNKDGGIVIHEMFDGYSSKAHKFK